jgi:hypothetical protein
MLREIEIPLHFNNLGLDPKDAGKLKFADVVQATFSVLTGRRGNQQWPLEVNADNELKVSAGGEVSVLGNEGLGFKQDDSSGVLYSAVSNAGGDNPVKVRAGDFMNSGDVALCVADPNVWEVLDDLRDIFNDVYDETEGALKTYS